jgi:hypothetical protein
VRHGPRSGDGRSATTTSPGWHAVGEMQAMSSPLADLQDSVSALHVTLRHLCRALEGNLGTWPTGDRLVAASSLQRLTRSSTSCSASSTASPRPVWKSNLQPDFNVCVRDSFDASPSAVLPELDESNRFVQKSAKSTSI